MLTKELSRMRKLLNSKKHLCNSFDNLINKIQNKDNIRVGKIIRVRPERKFCIIEDVDCPGTTYLGLSSDFSSYVNMLSDDLQDKLVEFIPTKTGNNITAQCISFKEEQEKKSATFGI